MGFLKEAIGANFADCKGSEVTTRFMILLKGGWSSGSVRGGLQGLSSAWFWETDKVLAVSL